MTGSLYVVKRKSGETPLWRNAGPPLERLAVELTERCNNDCIHCCINRPASDAAARAREMTTEQVKDILRQAADLGCLQVRFTGGEPFVRPDAEELYLFARRLGMKVLLFTNACLITPRLADLFARVPPLVNMEITVYGMRKESYEAVTRVPGSFTQFRRGINLLLGRNVPFVVKSVLLPQNEHEREEFETWARTIPRMTRPPNYVLFLDLRNRRDNAEKNARIKTLRLSPRKGLALLTRDAPTYRRDIAAFGSRFMGPPRDVLFGCGAGQSMCIDAYGRAQPCMGIRAPELTITPSPASEKGNGVVSLSDALAGFSRIRELRAMNPEYLRRCARCFLKGLCEQCPAKSWMEHGTLDTPVEYLCEVAHLQARYLGWLGENELGWEVMDWRERVNSKQLSGAGEASSVCRGGVSGSD